MTRDQLDLDGLAWQARTAQAQIAQSPGVRSAAEHVRPRVDVVVTITLHLLVNFACSHTTLARPRPPRPPPHRLDSAAPSSTILMYIRCELSWYFEVP